MYRTLYYFAWRLGAVPPEAMDSDVLLSEERAEAAVWASTRCCLYDLVCTPSRLEAWEELEGLRGMCLNGVVGVA